MKKKTSIIEERDTGARWSMQSTQLVEMIILNDLQHRIYVRIGMRTNTMTLHFCIRTRKQLEENSVWCASTSKWDSLLCVVNTEQPNVVAFNDCAMEFFLASFLWNQYMFTQHRAGFEQVYGLFSEELESCQFFIADEFPLSENDTVDLNFRI